MQFTIIFFYQQKRRAQKTGEGKETVGPEVPKRAEERREEREAQVRAKGNEGEHIEPQLAPADAQREEKGEKRGKHAVERVERAGQTPPCRPPQPHGAQQVIEERKDEAEQERGEKALRLLGERHAHGASTPEQAREQAAAV